MGRARIGDGWVFLALVVAAWILVFAVISGIVMQRSGGDRDPETMP